MALAHRYPWVRWMTTWGLSLVSFLSGLLTLMVFRRGIDHFSWILGGLLLLWVGGVAFAHLRQVLDARNRRMMRIVMDFTIQSLHHDLLLFLLPIYYASTTLSSRNALFFFLLLAAVILTAIDPWYQATILRYRWAAPALFAFGFFASMNVGLPLIWVRSAWALVLSALLSQLALIPALRRGFTQSWRNAVLVATLVGLLAASIIWSIRYWVPPAPLYLSGATFARSVEGLQPVEPVRKVSAADLQAWGGLACFTAISAPAGLREQIYHVWWKDGTPVTRIALSPIRGGRPGGYRTFSKRSDLGADPVGRWMVDVLTAEGQLIGRVRLVVTP
ncbi:MAG: DUF2914 domain-containing protein [candidate division NC10 bacterium]|nr:DUF2914 domain-containing protein [candidate division NC10 bacterium]